MARREVVEVICDRCTRTDYQAPGDQPAKGESSHEFKVVLHGKKTSYADLCKSCRKTLSNYYDKIIKAPKLDDEKEPKAGPESVPAPSSKTGGLFSRSKAAG